MSTVAVTQSTFRATVVEADRPVVVDYHAAWCGPCRTLAPVLEEIAAERPDVLVATVDVEAERTLAAMFQIMSLPTLQFFKDGAKVDEMIGAQTKKAILARLDSLG